MCSFPGCVDICDSAGFGCGCGGSSRGRTLHHAVPRGTSSLGAAWPFVSTAAGLGGSVHSSFRSWKLFSFSFFFFCNSAKKKNVKSTHLLLSLMLSSFHPPSNIPCSQGLFQDPAFRCF